MAFNSLRDSQPSLTQKVRENGPPALVQLQGIRGEDDFELYVSEQDREENKPQAERACVSGLSIHRLSQEGGNFAANLKSFGGGEVKRRTRWTEWRRRSLDPFAFFPPCLSHMLLSRQIVHLPKC